MTRLLSLTCVAALGLTAPGAASAAVPWSSPIDVGPAADYVESPRILFPARAPGFASWLVRSQPSGAGGLPGAVSVDYQGDDDGYSSRTATFKADGSPGTPRVLPHIIAAGPALDGSGRGLVLRTRIVASDAHGYRRQSVSWSRVTPRGTIGRAHHLFTATLVFTPTLAVDAKGRALAAWAELLPRTSKRRLWERFRVRATWRRPGGGFSRPVTLAQAVTYDSAGRIAVAINRAGRGVIAYADSHATRRGTRRAVHAWTAAAGGPFSRTLRVGPHAGSTHIAPVVTERGRVVIAWGTQDGGEEANLPYVVRAATLAPGARRFSAPQTLDPGGAVNRPQSGVYIAGATDGRVTVAWSAIRGATRESKTFPVMATHSDTAGRFAQAQQVAASGAVGGLAVRADGAAIVTFARSLRDQQTDQASAAIRLAGAASFDAPEAIANPDVASPPTVAFDPATGRPTVAWPARPGGMDPSQGIGRTAVLRFATRVAP